MQRKFKSFENEKWFLSRNKIERVSVVAGAECDVHISSLDSLWTHSVTLALIVLLLRGPLSAV